MPPAWPSSYAALDGRTTVTLADVQQASRTLNRQTLDTLAACVPTSGGWEHLAVSAQTCAELADLESRCRHRERLPAAVGAALGAQLNAGVRALFSGPSGTGKTLAARLLASELHMDLYRVDLSTVVNKYIGETEKNLHQIFARAEELDIILLLDEGDALLTQRTGVQTANDRYANLETNYLLQRLETFEGIIIVTTNAGERIDSAFQRRLDVVVYFRPPEAAERWSIWQLHLPADHAVDDALLREVAGRCTLTGGQIRNAVLHASLLALNDGGLVTSAWLKAAVQREYRKAGAVCPLRVGAGRSACWLGVGSRDHLHERGCPTWDCSAPQDRALWNLHASRKHRPSSRPPPTAAHVAACGPRPTGPRGGCGYPTPYSPPESDHGRSSPGWLCPPRWHKSSVTRGLGNPWPPPFGQRSKVASLFPYTLCASTPIPRHTLPWTAWEREPSPMGRMFFWARGKVPRIWR